MHTTVGPTGTVFHHNGDFSGLVKFRLDGEHYEVPFDSLVRALDALAPTLSVQVRFESPSTRPAYAPEFPRIELPRADVLSLVANRIRLEKISRLEEAQDDELYRTGSELLEGWSTREDPSVW